MKWGSRGLFAARKGPRRREYLGGYSVPSPLRLGRGVILHHGSRRDRDVPGRGHGPLPRRSFGTRHSSLSGILPDTRGAVDSRPVPRTPPSRVQGRTLHAVLCITAMCLFLMGCGYSVTLPTFTVLEVQVRTPSGEPVDGVRVEVLFPGDSVPSSEVTGSAGSFTYIGTPPGVYRIGVPAPPTGFAVPSTQENPLLVDVVEDEETTVLLTLVRQ